MRTWEEDGVADDTNEGAGDVDREGVSREAYIYGCQVAGELRGMGGTFGIVEPGEKRTGEGNGKSDDLAECIIVLNAADRLR
jgi:hypothetical protein